MQLSKEFKIKIREKVLEARKNYSGTDSQFAKTVGLTASLYSRLKKGDIDRLLDDSRWLEMARKHDVELRENRWKVARTDVYDNIESNLKFCQAYSKSMVLVDDCGIGKTFCARHIIKTMRNAFYFDCSQAKTRQQFVRQLAKLVGVDNKGRYIDVKENLKYYINYLGNVLIVIDEAGDLDYHAFLVLKELWNATEGNCGWYMMGADGLRHKIQKGIENKKVGYAEIFSRFSDEFITLIPSHPAERKQYMKQLIGSVASANVKAEAPTINRLVAKCLEKEASLRYLETLVKVAM